VLSKTIGPAKPDFPATLLNPPKSQSIQKQVFDTKSDERGLQKIADQYRKNCSGANFGGTDLSGAKLYGAGLSNSPDSRQFIDRHLARAWVTD
jgi:uncharacterized protein YjbI with pentapeptide repeats